MTPTNITLIGAPVQEGTHQPGCLMGPDAYRAAGLAQALRDLGHRVEDRGNLALPPLCPATHPNGAVHHLAEVSAWINEIGQATRQAGETSLPLILGGDHSLAAGSVPALAARAASEGRPFFVLWLDAHPDLHLLDTTSSGNLHGTPAAYFLGRDGFAGHYPALPARVEPANFCAMGLRSVDPAERAFIAEAGIEAHDMRAIDEHGIKAPLSRFLDRVAAANGHLHVSFDVDFLDPSIAPAVGTTVPGGATFREAHLIMELLHDSGLLTSMDLVELNPFLDTRGQTARLMVDLCASAFGRTILDRPTAA
ncbi:MAG: arginase [Rhodobacteraceae bacterium]|nr:arginase [Paracoccaceae bacterium]